MERCKLQRSLNQPMLKKTNQHEEELIKYNKRIDTAEHYAKKPFVQNDEKL